MATVIPSPSVTRTAIPTAQATSTALPVATPTVGITTKVIDDLERADAKRWWSFADRGAVLTCAVTQPGYASQNALQMKFEIGNARFGYTVCGIDIDAAYREGARQVSFFWRADRPGLKFSLFVDVVDPTQKNPRVTPGYTPFFVNLETAGAEWKQVILKLEGFAKDTQFVGNDGIAQIDPDRVAKIYLAPVNNQSGTVWIDDLQFGYLRSSVQAPTIVRPATGNLADIIYRNGVILTMESASPQAQAIAIQGEKILAVGSDAEIMALRGPQTRVVDLAGRTLMPGLIDGHSHWLADYNYERQKKTFDQAIETALALGLTSLGEHLVNETILSNLVQAEKAGRLRLRVNAFPQYNNSQLNAAGKAPVMQVWYPANKPILDAEKRLRIPGIKVFVDGDYTPARGCWALTDPLPASARADYPFCRNDLGDLYMTQDELNQVVAGIQNAGFRASFHSMGDRAIKTTLNAIEFALRGESNERYRHQIQHNSLLPPDQLQRYVNLKVIASVRGNFNTCEQDWIYMFDPARVEWTTNRFALPGVGAHTYVEMDFAWRVDPLESISIANANPFVHIYGLTTRQQALIDGTVCKPNAVLAKHKVSVAQALQMFTLEPAFAVSQENVLGSLKPGKFADVIILSTNPLTIDPNALRDVKVLMTMVGGKVEYCASGQNALCPR